MSALETAIKGAMTSVLRDWGYDAHEVVAYKDTTRTEGHCSTCRSERAYVDIVYVDSNGDHRIYEYSGSFAGLIRALDASEATL